MLSSNRKILNVKSTNKPLSPGDLVIPEDEEEQIYFDLTKRDPHFVWSNSCIGVVIEADNLIGKTYNKVKVLVGEQIGWTYSDYLKEVKDF